MNTLKDNLPTLNAYIRQVLTECATLPALSDLHGETFTYAEVTRQIARFHVACEAIGIKPGDKIAFCGKNSAHWAMAVLASITYGAVSVPILHDFNTDSIHHLVDHSDSHILFVDEAIWRRLDPKKMPQLKLAIRISDYGTLYAADTKTTKAIGDLDKIFLKRFPNGVKAQDLRIFDDSDPDAVAIINYTSGSTGMSKGVMLSRRALWSNIQYCIDGLRFLVPGDGMVSMLPLAHMFGLMVEMLHPFVKGCHISFITRVPSPRVILDAFATVRPKLIITVPLVLEKIIRSRVIPMLKTPKMRLLTHTPFVSGVVYNKIREKLIEAFGGRVREIIIGGAALNKDVERLLRRIRFPYTVGYGMTECGPLIAYSPWRKQRPQSCGYAVDRMELRIDSADPETVPGVLWVRGDNVMNGYYKNDEATESVLKDGWMCTGDICTIDADGFVYIRGRDKNMILGPSGQNIYPEEIEAVLNNLPLVAESVVIEEKGKIIALIHPDMEAVERDGITDDQLMQLMRDNVAKANTMVNSFSRIADLRIHREEFEKTPKRSIKRFLYQKS